MKLADELKSELSKSIKNKKLKIEETIEKIESDKLKLIEDTLQRGDLTDEELLYVESVLKSSLIKVNYLLKVVATKITNANNL